MDIPQFDFTHHRIALIYTVLGTAITDKMFRRGNHMSSTKTVCVVTLETDNHFTSIGFNDFWVFGIAFIGSTPSVIAHNRESRSKYPINTGHRHFKRGGFADLTHQRGIVHRPKADFVRKNSRANNIVMAVNGIGTPDNRNTHATVANIGAGVVKTVRKGNPAGNARVLATGPSTAAIEYRAEIKLTDLSGANVTNFRLYHLPDFFSRGHLGQH